MKSIGRLKFDIGQIKQEMRGETKKKPFEEQIKGLQNEIKQLKGELKVAENTLKLALNPKLEPTRNGSTEFFVANPLTGVEKKEIETQLKKIRSVIKSK